MQDPCCAWLDACLKAPPLSKSAKQATGQVLENYFFRYGFFRLGNHQYSSRCNRLRFSGFPRQYFQSHSF
jgi:hypothetical protein